MLHAKPAPNPMMKDVNYMFQHNNDIIDEKEY